MATTRPLVIAAIAVRDRKVSDGAVKKSMHDNTRENTSDNTNVIKTRWSVALYGRSMADEARNELFSARHPLLAKSVWLRTLQPRRLRLNYLKSPAMDISPRIGFPTDEALNRLT